VDRAIFDDWGNIVEFQAVGRDVTEQKQAEQALRLSEEQMRLTVQKVPIMLDALDEHGNITVWNAECERVTGYSAEEIVNKTNSLQLLYPDPVYRDQLFNQWLSKNSDYINQESIITCKNGTRKIISWTHNSRTNPIPGWADWGIGVDITERKKAKEDLVESNRRFAALISNLPGMAYRCLNDSYWTMEFMSSGCLELTGFSPEDFYHSKNDFSYNSCIHPADQERIWEEVQMALEKKKAFRLVYRFISATGEQKWFWEQGKGVSDEAGNLLFLEGFIQDITDRKKAEESVIAAIIETEDKERKRISNEIHDSLGQNLTTAILNLQSMKSELENPSTLGMQLYERGIFFLNTAIAESRAIAHNLMPKAIEDFGYVLATENMLDGLKDVGSTRFSFFNNLEGKRLPKRMEITLFRITQEAINNIIRHAKAKEATIQLIKNAHSCILTIEGNGVGFSIPQQDTGSYKQVHLGIRSMKNRAKSLSGLFNIDSGSGKGTTITIKIPHVQPYAR